LSLVPLLPAAWLLRREAALEVTVRPPDVEAVRAVTLMDRELPGQPPSIGFILGHPRWRATDPEFRAAVERTLAPLRADPRVAREDLRRSELVVLPLVLVLLLLVFGSAVAAALPLLVGMLAVALGLAGTVILGSFVSVSAYANNVVSMVGLGVAIDYSLFV